MPASALMNIMQRAARKAGRSLVRDFGEVEQLQVSVKGPADFVSRADMRAEQIVFEELRRARADYGFLMEEQGVVAGADKTHRWIIDPLDGTTNFLHGIPLFAVSIALQREGQIVAAVVFNPAMDELFTAERGKGAFLNDRRIRVAGRRRIEDAVIVTGIPHRGKPEHGRFLRECGHVMERAAGVRRSGSAALDLAWVAAGRFDGYWERRLKPWDLAAGILIVREAGGMVSDADGGQGMLENGSILCGNEYIHRALGTLLREATPKSVAKAAPL